MRDTPGGKLYRTRYTCSEAEIRKRHPYAEKIESSRVLRQIGETHAEIWQNQHSQNMPREPSESDS